MLPRRLRRCCFLIAFAFLVFPPSLSAQENPSQGNSPLESNDFQISAGGSTLYAGFGRRWGATLAAEFIFIDIDVGSPLELAFGAGAVGNVFWSGGQTLWSAGAFGSAHLFPGHNFGIFLQLGAAYAFSRIQIAGVSASAGGIGFVGAAGLELFLSDSFAIYVESRLNSIGAGVRLKL